MNVNQLCTGDYRHINILYLFVKYRFESKKILITYCNAEHMLADNFPKALQEAQFAKFRDVNMGWKHVDTLHMGPPSTISTIM